MFSERLLFLRQCTRTNKDVQFPRNSMIKNLLKYFQSCFRQSPWLSTSRGILKSCVRAFERFDYTVAHKCTPNSKTSHRIPKPHTELRAHLTIPHNTRVAERPEVTFVRNKQCNYNSRPAVRGKIRLVENRL